MHLLSQVENAHPSEEEGVVTEAVGVGGQPSVVPAPILEPIMPTRTRLQEAAAEVAMYYSQIEGQVTYDTQDLTYLYKTQYKRQEIR